MKDPTIISAVIELLVTGQVQGRRSSKNMIYHETGWVLSYNPYCCDTDQSETAIILGNSQTFLILYGDHREALRGLSRDDAMEFWKSKPELHGATSDDMED